jgi:Skp family chaperone for outer membrane proteins
MTKAFKNLFLIGLALGLMSTSSFAQGRIGMVDLQKLFDSYWKTKTADAALKDRRMDLESEAKKLREDFAKSKEEWQKLSSSANDQAVSAEERDKRKKAADTKLKDLKDTEETIVQFDKQAMATLEEQMKRMRENILTEIRGLVNAEAKSGGFAMVIDSAALTMNRTPVILYTNGDNDLTPAVLKQLNIGAPADFGKSAEKPADAGSSKSNKPTEKK